MLRRRPVLSTVTALYLLAVGWVTLGPQPVDAGANGWVRQAIAAVDGLPGLGWVTYPGVEFTANVVMFVPMGILLIGIGIVAGIDLAWRPLKPISMQTH